jgi:hypothetical protein
MNSAHAKLIKARTVPASIINIVRTPQQPSFSGRAKPAAY